jgi:membrane protease YdiL (CAAX protease family)
MLQSVNPEQLSPALLLLAALLSVLLIAGVVCDIFVLIHLRRKPINSPDMTARLLATRWTLNDAGKVLLAIAALYLFFGGYALFLRFSKLSIATDCTEAVSALVETLSFQIVVLAAILSIMKSKGISWREAFGLERANLGKNIRLGVFIYLAALPVFFSYSAIYILLLKEIGIEIEFLGPQEVVSIMFAPDLPHWLQACLFIMAVVTGPVIEELFFRGVAVPAVGRHFRMLPAIYLISIAFAIFHQYAPAIVPLFIIAVAFSLGYLYSGSIVVPVTMHILFNAGMLALLLLKEDIPLETLGLFRFW